MRWMSGKRIVAPSDLTNFTAGDIRAPSDNAPSLERVPELCQTARIDSDKGKRRSVNLPFSTQPSCLAQSARVADIADSSVARVRECAQTAIDLYTDFEKAGTMAKIRALTGADDIPEKMLRVLYSGVNRNISRQKNGSLNSAASGIPSYISRCDLLPIDYYRPQTNRLKQREAILLA